MQNKLFLKAADMPDSLVHEAALATVDRTFWKILRVDFHSLFMFSHSKHRFTVGIFFCYLIILFHISVSYFLLSSIASINIMTG